MNTEAIPAYLNTPITRKRAFVALGVQAFLSYSAAQAARAIVLNNVKKRLDVADHKIAALKEMCVFMLERSDTETIEELNKKVDFWATVLEVNMTPATTPQEDGHMKWCARTDCYTVSDNAGGEKNVCVDYVERQKGNL